MTRALRGTARVVGTGLRRLRATYRRDGEPDRSPLSVFQRRQDVLLLVLVAGWIVALVLRYVRGAYQNNGYAFPGGAVVVNPDDSFLFTRMPGSKAYLTDAGAMDWGRVLFSPRYSPTGQGWGYHLFGDLYQPWRETRQTSPYYSDVPEFFRSVYPPFAHLLLRPLSWLPYNAALAVFLVLVLAGLGVVTWALLPATTRADRLQTTCALTVCSYPLLFLLDRANTEAFALVVVLLAFLVWDGPHRRWIFLLLGLAAATKLFPAAFALVLLRRKRYAAAIAAGVTAVLLTLVALLTFGGGFQRNVDGFLNGLATFTGKSGIDDVFSVRYSSSLVSGIRALAHIGWLPPALAAGSGAIALVVGIALLVILLALRLELWAQCLLVVFLITVVPSGAFDYRTVYVLVPLLLALRSTTPVPSWAVAGMGMLLVPKNYYVMYADVSVSVVLTPLIALALTVAIAVRARRPWHGVRALVAAGEPA